MHTQKSKIFKLFLLALLFIILLSNSKSITNPGRIKFTDSAEPALNFSNNSVSFLARLIPFASLREENRLLHEKISLLSRRLEEARSLYSENERLKALIDFRKTIPYSTVPAEVIGRDPTNWSNSLVINKGLDNGLAPNKAVLSTRGLVGRIVEIGRRSAKILLVTDPNSKVGVAIQKNRQGGMLVGRSDGTCKMIYIAIDSDVKAGDRVITAGFGSIFPKDIPVGDVVAVGKEPGRLYKYAIIKPVQDLSRLEEVLCAK